VDCRLQIHLFAAVTVHVLKAVFVDVRPDTAAPLVKCGRVIINLGLMSRFVTAAIVFHQIIVHVMVASDYNVKDSVVLI
jgi:hypothetical protein